MKKIDRMIEIMDGLIDQLGKQEDGLPLGWRCPVCGRGLAPHVSECSCIQFANSEDGNIWKNALDIIAPREA